MKRLILLAALVLAWAAPSAAQMTCNGANFAFGINTSSAAPTLALPTSAPVGATLVAGVINRTDETTTLTVADGANGAWTVSSPADSASATMRGWMAYFVNNGSNAAHTVTFTYSGTISSQYIVGWCSDAGGAQTFDSFAPTVADTALSTNHASNTVTMDGAGGIVGMIVHNNVVTFTMGGAGESNIEGGAAGQRVTAVFQAVSGAGAEGFESTASANSASLFFVAGFLNAVGGGGGTGHTRCTLVGVCE